MIQADKIGENFVVNAYTPHWDEGVPIKTYDKERLALSLIRSLARRMNRGEEIDTE